MFGWGMMGAFGGLGMGIGMVVWIVGFALVVWWLALLVRDRSVTVQDSALDILKRRYARGEISKAEFEQARRDLA